MSTAANHRKRSHRSQAVHYRANARRRAKNIVTQRGNETLKAMLMDRTVGRIRRAVAAAAAAKREAKAKNADAV